MRRIIGLAIGVMLVGVALIARAAPSPQQTALDLFIFNLRSDMELLADEVFGAGNRPENWTYEADPDAIVVVIDYGSETVVGDLWFDGEQLANVIFGDDWRPVGWLGVTSNRQDILARNVRHDIEITADAVFELAERPTEWYGAPPLLRCERTLQNLVAIARDIYAATIVTAETIPNYCEVVETEFMTVHLPAALDGYEGGLQNVNELAWWLRGDLERLMDELLGVGNRDVEWIGNIELGSETMLEDVSRDLERLAGDEFTTDVRPEGWMPFVVDAPATSYINLRSNLEIFTDYKLGEGVRPLGWQGLRDDPMSACKPITRALVLLAEKDYEFLYDPTILETEDDYCAVLEAGANEAIEVFTVDEVQQVAEETRYRAQSRNAFTYLDVEALQFMGIMPWDVEFRAWYRNFHGSSMMFVSGLDFAVFIDRRWTTMEQEIFNTLPTLDGVKPLTFCDAPWCNGPGPTPTPTGSGPLELLLFNSGGVGPTPVVLEDGTVLVGKQQVSWNHIRVTYVADFPDRGIAQVGLEICAEPTQVTCEPVVSVFDNSLGIPKPVLFQTNGLNVYEIAYGYISNLLIEGSSFVSPDVFVSDPTIR